MRKKPNVDVPFKVGGALEGDSKVYVERQAEEKIFEHLQKMNYVKIIAPRQQGKSSFINRLKRLYTDYSFVTIDFSVLDPQEELAYQFLCEKILKHLEITPEEDFFPFPKTGTEWYRFLITLSDFCQKNKTKLVIVLDEIGTAKQLPWIESFFTKIRAIYGEREERSSLENITFLLAGAYIPSKLIQNPQFSPFNIASQVKLPDFDFSQIIQLVTFFPLPETDQKKIAKAIHQWTDGQPYLTQLICRYMAESSDTPSTEDVASAVNRIAREDENHLPPIIEALGYSPDLQEYVVNLLKGGEGEISTQVCFLSIPTGINRGY